MSLAATMRTKCGNGKSRCSVCGGVCRGALTAWIRSGPELRTDGDFRRCQCLFNVFVWRAAEAEVDLQSGVIPDGGSGVREGQSGRGMLRGGRRRIWPFFLLPLQMPIVCRSVARICVRNQLCSGSACSRRGRSLWLYAQVCGAALMSATAVSVSGFSALVCVVFGRCVCVCVRTLLSGLSFFV